MSDRLGIHRVVYNKVYDKSSYDVAKPSTLQVEGNTKQYSVHTAADIRLFSSRAAAIPGGWRSLRSFTPLLLDHQRAAIIALCILGCATLILSLINVGFKVCFPLSTGVWVNLKALPKSSVPQHHSFRCSSWLLMMAMTMKNWSWRTLAVPGVLTLIAFLTASPQLLFRSLDPHPLTASQTLIFNALVLSMLVSYGRLFVTSPGFVPLKWTPQPVKDDRLNVTAFSRRWCRKCQNLKPPRAHHCKICKRCVLKMDHHCPWTMNCISHCTLPHYIRFLFYAICSMAYLQYFLYIRLAAMWDKRNLPYYLGPSTPQILHIIVLALANSFTLFTLLVLFVRSVWSMGENMTTIEGWEVERHKALNRRARVQGGYLNGPHGKKIRFARQEFPYDIGIWSNLVQGMGTRNLFAWFSPLSASPSPQTGFEFEENGFEDPGTLWPPPDPDRMLLKGSMLDNFAINGLSADHGFPSNYNSDAVSAQYNRAPQLKNTARQRLAFGDHSIDELDVRSMGSRHEDQRFEHDGFPWKNWEGETLDDFGVDEGAELYDENDVLTVFAASQPSRTHD